MKRTFAYGAATTQGLWPVQEDGFFADPISGRFAVADGFGGRGQGDHAAKICLAEVRVRATTENSDGLSPLAGWQNSLLQEANRKLVDWNEKRAIPARGGASVLLANASEGGFVTLTGSGACTALLLRGGRVQPLLLAQAHPRAGMQAALLPFQALGLSHALRTETRFCALEVGDMLLLVSSGLEWEGAAFASDLESLLSVHLAGSNLSGLASGLLEAASLQGNPWNATVVAVERTA